MSTQTPTPPTGFQSWLDYAVATMDAGGAFSDRVLSEDEILPTDTIRVAAQQELDRLKQRIAMPAICILENWQAALATRLGRTAANIVDDNLLAADFADSGVHIQFKDGSDLKFNRAFFVGETPADGNMHRVAVFSEHCGYHEFWIGPGDQISKIPMTSGEHEVSGENRI
ncbi:hypothetical protein [Variovorax sp. HJSM1_2]|uniref:hypothetical protein n=1 Tax=Variovorax sp. HJSM1_2 TaxID=3366263 RepID=UPI003BC451E7